ncbi:PQQ-like domain-containing protein [Chitinophaga jiangningensis]|uniref:PQQ-like domain-containing protein n=1 Tax=Chitinophaga jiangningensis TaxID=1419482 RepID=A0A1M7L6C1_9BACT|nr:PQQ-binding-like beta-propeller repeat protein [Chitinophaga jiangningensis]SHM73673.1 PQQ-like domain-containing protein [Chitinophaga jiangningensis]
MYQKIDTVYGLFAPKIYKGIIVGTKFDDREILRVGPDLGKKISQLGNLTSRIITVDDEKILIANKEGVFLLDNDLQITERFPILPANMQDLVADGDILYGTIKEQQGVLVTKYDYVAGTIIWQTTVAAANQVLLHNGFCYVWGSTGLVMTAINAASGVIIWQHTYAETSSPFDYNFQPYLTNRHIIVRYASENMHGLAAVDLQTGKEQYRQVVTPKSICVGRLIYALKKEDERNYLAVIDDDTGEDQLYDISVIVAQTFELPYKGLFIAADSTAIYIWSEDEKKALIFNTKNYEMIGHFQMETEAWYLQEIISEMNGNRLYLITNDGEIQVMEKKS